MNLQNLTSHKCVEIAKIAVPEVEGWSFYDRKGVNDWNGFDVVSGENSDGSYDHYFQISFEGELVYFDKDFNDFEIPLDKVSQILREL